KVNIEGHIYDILMGAYTQEIKLVEEHTRISAHLNDGEMVINGAVFYVNENTDGTFTVSDMPDASDPDAVTTTIDSDAPHRVEGSVDVGGETYDASVMLTTEYGKADITGDRIIDTKDYDALVAALAAMPEVDITGDAYAGREDLDKMKAIILGIESGQLLDPRDYYRVDMNANGVIDKQDWEIIENAFAKLYLDQDISADGVTAGADGYINHLDWEYLTSQYSTDVEYEGVYTTITAPARAWSGKALFNMEDVIRAIEIERFMWLGVGYEITYPAGVYSTDFIVYDGTYTTLVERCDVTGDGIVDEADRARIKEVVSRMVQYDINGDLAINDDDLSAWDAVKAYVDLGMTMSIEDTATANLTGDFDPYIMRDIVDLADRQRYWEISGYNPINGTFRNFDVNLDGKITMLDVSYIARVYNLNTIITGTILPFLQEKEDVEWTLPSGGYTTSILNHIDEMETMLIDWADLNADGEVDQVDMDTYEVLYIDYMQNNGTPLRLDVPAPGDDSIDQADKTWITGVKDYLENLALYGGPTTYDMKNVLAMKAMMELLEQEVVSAGVYDTALGEYTTARTYLGEVLFILGNADFDSNNMLTVNDLARFNDAYEAEGLKEELGITQKADLYSIDPTTGYYVYDVNRDGAIDNRDLRDLKAAFDNFADYDIASYASTDVNGDGAVDENDLATEPDGVVDAADLAFLEIAEYFQYVEF
ncbi:MAG: hypothetical protein WBD17_05705, partial [Candidatus Omnitrophota bacterium]